MNNWLEWTEGNKWQLLLDDVSRQMSKKRFDHTLRVVAEAEKLAKHHGYSDNKVALAALFHDYAKEFTKDDMVKILIENNRSDFLELAPAVWHAAVGAYVIRERYPFGADIFDSICYHTTGRAGMTELEMLTFLADYTEPNRDYPGLNKIREKAWNSLDDAMYTALNLNLEKLVKHNFMIAETTVEARNYFLNKKETKDL